MRRVLLTWFALLACACSSGADRPVDAGDDAATAPDTATPVDAATEAGRYLPAGYAQMAFLSDAPVHKFTGAPDGGAPQQVIDGTHDYVAVLDTDVGRIVMHLLSQIAPVTVNSFVFLALHHFYDGVAFHRVIDQFMAQTGDPNSISGAPGTWGTGGCGYTFGLEVNPAYNYDDAGVVGMARTNDPNSNGSQFFILFAPYPSLNQQYTVWADVIEGLDVLPNIVRGEPPTDPTRIQDVYVGMK